VHDVGVVEDAQHRRHHQIVNTSPSIGGIAYRLGYSEPAAFTHAFTRRFGRSPRVARSPG